MKILIACRSLPYPQNIGVKIRTFNLIKHLSKKHDISLVCYADSDNQENNIRRMREYCDSIRLVQREKKSKIMQLPRIVKNLISALPWNVKYVKSREMQNAILEITKAKCIDIVHIDDPYMATNFDFVTSSITKKTVTFVDIDSVRFKRMLRNEKDLYKRIKIILNLLPMQRWESKIAKSFDLCIVVSSIDKRLLESKNSKLKIVIIPNGVDTEFFKKLPLSNHHQNISFFGAMDYPPNIKASVYFYSKILPLIKKRLPNVKFVIVGRKPASQIKKLAADPSVIVTGYVEDVIPYYKSSAVVVVPLNAGGGSRLKILEAMALGRPIVSTTVGAEGLEVTNKENIIISDIPEEFARNVINLMTNMPVKKRLIENARKFVESYHSWPKIVEKLDQVYQELCALG